MLQKQQRLLISYILMSCISEICVCNFNYMLIDYFYAYVPLTFLSFKWKLNIVKVRLIRDFWNASNLFQMPEQPSTIQSVNKTSLGVFDYLYTSDSIFICSHRSWI